MSSSMRQRVPNSRHRSSSTSWEIERDEDASSPSSGPLHTQKDLPNFHTLYRTAHHVPDNRYQQYLRGQTAKRKTSILNKHCLATTCAGFSAVGCIFLFSIGLLVDLQPLYIPGVLQLEVNATSRSTKKIIPGPDSERLPAARVAYQASFAYFVLILICYCILHPELLRFLRLAVTEPRQCLAQWRNPHYEDIPDHDSTIPQFLQQQTDSEPYRLPCWNRCTIGLTNWLYARGWYTPTRPQKRPAKTV